MWTSFTVHCQHGVCLHPLPPKLSIFLRRCRCVTSVKKQFVVRELQRVGSTFDQISIMIKNGEVHTREREIQNKARTNLSLNEFPSLQCNKILYDIWRLQIQHTLKYLKKSRKKHYLQQSSTEADHHGHANRRYRGTPARKECELDLNLPPGKSSANLSLRWIFWSER